MIYFGFICAALFIISLFVKMEFNTGLTKAILLILAIGFTAGSSFRTVPNGAAGLVDIFGKVQNEALAPGINFPVNPFATIINRSTRTQEMKATMVTPTNEQLSCELEVSCFYHIPIEAWPELYKTVANGNPMVLIEPNFRSITRDITAEQEAAVLYTGDRSLIAGKLKDNMIAVLSPRGIVIEDTPLRSVKLPSTVVAAIDAKASAEQDAQKMVFVLQKETQEAERKRIEAQGIQDFQTIVSKGINENLLRWKGIEATMELAASQNAKTVVIGAGKDGLPLILGK